MREGAVLVDGPFFVSVVRVAGCQPLAASR